MHDLIKELESMSDEVLEKYSTEKLYDLLEALSNIKSEFMGMGLTFSLSEEEEAEEKRVSVQYNRIDKMVDAR